MEIDRSKIVREIEQAVNEIVSRHKLSDSLIVEVAVTFREVPKSKTNVKFVGRKLNPSKTTDNLISELTWDKIMKINWPTDLKPVVELLKNNGNKEVSNSDLISRGLDGYYTRQKINYRLRQNNLPVVLKFKGAANHSSSNFKFYLKDKSDE